MPDVVPADTGSAVKNIDFRSLFDNHHTAMLIIDPEDSRIIEANPKAESFYGWSHEKLCSMRISEINTAPREEVLLEMARAKAEQRHQFFFKHRLASGIERDVEVFSGPIEMDGRTLLYSIIHDITARRQAEKALAERETVFRQLTEQVPAIIYRAELDALSQTTYISPRIAELGYTPAEWIADPALWIEALHPADRDRVLRQLEEFHAGDSELLLEYRLRHRNGSWRHYRDQGTILRDADGRPLYLQGLMIDISELKHLESSLSHLAARSLHMLELPRLADTLDEADFMQRGLEMAETLTASAISFIHFVNQDEESLELVTWSRNTLEHYCTAAFDRHYPVSQAGIWAEALRQRQPVVFNDYAAAPGKRGLPAGHASLQRLISVPVIEHDKVVMLAGIGNRADDYLPEHVDTLQLIANDIWRLVQRGRNQKQLARFSRLLERSTTEIYTFEADSLRFVDVNHGACHNLGYSLEELRGMTPLDIKPDMTRTNLLDLFAPLRNGERQSVALATRHARKDGTTYPVEVQIEISDDANPLFIATGRDMTEKQRIEQTLRESIKHLSELNHKLEAAQNQLLQSEKMASIGQLAAGVAHELNNPISFVHSNLGTLEKYLQDIFAIADAYTAAAAACGQDGPQFEQVRTLRQAKDYDFLRSDIPQLMAESKDGLERVRKIVQDLKDFSRAGDAQMQWADLHAGLDSTLNVVWNELKYKCTVAKEYGSQPRIWCEPSQINQVFMNLLINAGHAIADKGEITLRTGQLNDEVFVAIADTGCGIPPENLNRLFEPFFTTKPVGKGTGLGLSLAYSIIQKHHGRITVDSTPGHGTTFTVWLPIEAPQDDAVPPASTFPGPAS